MPLAETTLVLLIATVIVTFVASVTDWTIIKYAALGLSALSFTMAAIVLVLSAIINIQAGRERRKERQ